MFSYDLSKLTFDKGTYIAFFVFSMVVSPIWFIFQFYPELFKNTDLIKLIILGLGISIPLLLVNLFAPLGKRQKKLEMLLAGGDSDKKKAEELSYEGLFISCATTVFVIYTPCFLKFFFTFGQKGAIIISIVMNLLFLFLQLRNAVLHGDD